MKFLKSILLVTAFLGIALALCSCELMINKFKFETKDLNGDDDYSLAVFTDDDICVQDNACYCVAFGLAPSGTASYSNEEYLHDADLIEANAKSPLSGVSLLQKTYGTHDTITFTVECSRTKGNVRIVLLDENLNIIHDFSITEKTSYTVNDAKGKEFEIRIAGESAEFSVKVSREFSDK